MADGAFLSTLREQREGFRRQRACIMAAKRPAPRSDAVIDRAALALGGAMKAMAERQGDFVQYPVEGWSEAPGAPIIVSPFELHVDSVFDLRELARAVLSDGVRATAPSLAVERQEASLPNAA